MQGNARGKYESGGCARVTQGNAGEYRRIQGNAKGTYGSGCKVPEECWERRGMPRERMGVGVNCQGNAGNEGECQGNVWEWVYSARGMQGDYQGNAREWV